VNLRFAIWFAGLAALPAIASAAPQPPSTHDDEIVVRGSVARAEIERILGADNLDTVARPPRDVADTMARIPRGRAPADFWRSYERHLDAWEHFAQASDSPDDWERIAAERALNTTFDEVERIARRYGAHMPQPRTAMRSVN
jgi:hypothetical protein